MAYKVIILYRLYMPSYVLGTFTEYPLFIYKRSSLFFLFGNHQIIVLLSALNQQVFFIQQVSSRNHLVKGT